MLGKVGVLEDHDVIIGPGGRHAVPHTGERVLEVVRTERHVEYADIVGRADGRVRERLGELTESLLVTRGPSVLHEHRHDVVSGHP